MTGSDFTTRLPARLSVRSQITSARRIVIKVGSSSLTTPDGHLDDERVRSLADDVITLTKRGCDVVLVSSGAIAAALGVLGLPGRPSDIAVQQAAASVGQAILARAWSRAFERHDRITGQVLLTESDVIRSETYRNVRSNLEALLELGVIPVVNENDATATHEIRFGDNDRLASLVSQLIGADLLVLLTDVDALYTAPPKEPGARRIELVEDASQLEGVSVGSVGSTVGTGGMVTKLAAAQHAASTGTATLLTSAANARAVLEGAEVGTFFPAKSGRRRSRLVWLRFATRGAGTIRVDAGAVDALRTRRRSLLAVGITGVEGAFPAGVPVDVAGPDGTVIVRGLVAFSSEEITPMMGLTTGSVRRTLGERYARPVVHRDDLVVL
ncbi:glutamate 5-kinase [Brachybacterium hainanense]|uniref:Glutamate 5-kinase n=1 Tax=Brachybacterium hainanense TaxID=1541174 RepID=A0ABV6RCV1_9MICO